jgi:putative N6-adenine-specific DNA methylase
MVAPFPLFVSSAPGIEPLLCEELAALGMIDPKVVPGGVEGLGHRRVIYRANLESGLATHVLVRIGEVVATEFAVLERRLGELPFERFVRAGVPRAFRVTARKSRLIHTGAIAERAARAIAARLGDAVEDAAEERLPSEPQRVAIQIRMERDLATISLDTSGAPLHRRGYRLVTGKAPLREDLARALVIASGWDRCSPLIDPFAGSGTIAIEAALLARGTPPGFARRFAFERTPLFDEAAWSAVREATSNAGAAPPILAGDRDASAIAAARENAAHASVGDAIELVHASVGELPFGSTRATVVTNPPYGHRLGEVGDLAPLYRTLGRRFRELPPGSRIALATSERRLGMRVHEGLRTAFVTQSGGLRIRALAGET